LAVGAKRSILPGIVGSLGSLDIGGTQRGGESYKSVRSNASGPSSLKGDTSVLDPSALDSDQGGVSNSEPGVHLGEQCVIAWIRSSVDSPNGADCTYEGVLTSFTVVSGGLDDESTTKAFGSLGNVNGGPSVVIEGAVGSMNSDELSRASHSIRHDHTS
jgi:hypothetical protein